MPCADTDAITKPSTLRPSRGGRLLRGEIVKQSLKVEGSNAVLTIFETLGSHTSGLERWRELLAHFGSLCGLFKIFGRTFDGYCKTKLMGLLSQS
jgi:hypothetical protein